jgi:uncharacterized protein YpmB
MYIQILINILILFGICFVIATIITPIVVIIHDKHKAREYDKIQKVLHEEYLERAKQNKKKSKDDLYIIINRTEDKNEKNS